MCVCVCVGGGGGAFKSACLGGSAVRLMCNVISDCGHDRTKFTLDLKRHQWQHSVCLCMRAYGRTCLRIRACVLVI